MNAADRIAYAGRKLADAQKEAANAQAYLEWALGVAQDEIDQANRELVAPGALIAEFGGKLYVSLRSAGFDIRHEVAEFEARAVVAGRMAHLRCECGQTSEWDAPGWGKAVAYRYSHSESAVDRKYHLTIVRTRLDAPPCEHWLQVPLKMDPA